MARDTEPPSKSAPDARASVRLCNIPTGTARLLDAHKMWLDKVGKEIVRASSNPWIDIYGYASHLGNHSSNKKLSDDRCDAVMRYIQDFNLKAQFPQEWGYGDSLSTG